MQIRVSSEISNGQIILNVDCDMYSNNSFAVRDALCFFMDEKKGYEIAYVQYPQNFDNVTKNEPYSSTLRVLSQVSNVLFSYKIFFSLLSILLISETIGGIPWCGWLWRPPLCWNWLLS